MNNGTNGNKGNGRIEFLKQKEREIRTKLAEEQTRFARRMEKENRRLFSLVGEAVCQRAARHPDFDLLIKEVLQTGVTVESDRNFLRQKGRL